MIPVILSGGSGARLWPLSRKAKPKQFLSIAERILERQNTVLKLRGGVRFVSNPPQLCSQ